MDHKFKVVGQVCQTKDYSAFKKHPLNRTIKERLLKKLRKSMSRIGWLDGSHVLVSKTFKILDGQHRLVVAEELGLPVQYVVVHDTNVEKLIVEHNQNKEVWSFMDNIETQAKMGNQNYILLQRFIKNFPHLRPTECIMLVKNGVNSSSREEIGLGNLKLGDLHKGYEWGHNIMKMKQYIPKYYNKSIFVRALVKIFSNKPEFIFDEFVHKVELRPSMLKPQGTVKQYIENIEEIYNYRRSNGDKINLRDL